MEYRDSFKNEFKKRVYRFVLETIKLLDNLPKERVSYTVGDQLIRSTTSILANFVEGQGSSSRKELIRYMEMSLRSANESKVWFSILIDTNRIENKNGKLSLKELGEIANILGSSILSLKKIKKI